MIVPSNVIVRPSASQVEQQIDRICSSDRFCASPTLTTLLRRLAAAKTASDPAAVAFSELEDDTSAAVVDGGKGSRLRVQMTRLRQALNDFYAGPGAADPVVIELPVRSSVLRIVERASEKPTGVRSTAEQSQVVILVASDHGLPSEFAWLPDVVTRSVLVDFHRFRSIQAVGPYERDEWVRHPGDPTVAKTGDRFILDLGVHPGGERLVVTARLLTGDSAGQLWAETFFVPARAAGQGDAVIQLVSQLTAAIGDETGVIQCETMRRTAGKPAYELSVREAIAAVWRFWMSGRLEDHQTALDATQAACVTAPNSGLALAYRTAMQLEEYIWSENEAFIPSQELLDSFERARSLAPHDPWVEIFRGFALGFAGKVVDVMAITTRLESVPSSGSFKGMLASLMMLSADHDFPQILSMFDRALQSTPQPPHWVSLHAACAAFAADDIEAAERYIETVSNRAEPLSMIIRSVIAVRRGDVGTARRFAREVLEVQPGFATWGKYLICRTFTERFSDPVDRAWRSIGIDWLR